MEVKTESVSLSAVLEPEADQSKMVINKPEGFDVK